MKNYTELELAMLAGYFAIINNKKLYGSEYTKSSNQSIDFLKAAKLLACQAEDVDPDSVIFQLNGVEI